MDFYDKLKRFLGFPARQESPNFHDQPSSRQWQEPPSSRDESDRGAFHNFSVFTDPLEIHKYFEQQMSEMLRNFGFSEFGDGFSHQFDFPQVEEAPEESVTSGDLREQFLKPGFEKAGAEGNGEKKDRDIDGKLDLGDWGSVFRGESAVAPYQRQGAPKTRFFGQSVTSKTIRNPDGSIETHHTVRDNEGNEETTIKRKIGDKEYSITKRKDKDGKEETIENLVNLNEKDVEKFFPQQQKVPQLDQQPWPYFDRFFK